MSCRPRPLTHDLLLTTIGELGATLTKVIVTEIRDRTYYAELHLDTQSGEKVLSSRPSDAIALAVRCAAPLFAADDLIDEVGQDPPVGARGRRRRDHRRVQGLHRERQPRRLRQLTRPTRRRRRASRRMREQLCAERPRTVHTLG